MRAFLLTGNSQIAPIYGCWLKKIHPGFGSKIADVGCGSGQLLYELFASGYSDLHGFDPFIEKSVKINMRIRILEIKERFQNAHLSAIFQNESNAEVFFGNSS